MPVVPEETSSIGLSSRELCLLFWTKHGLCRSLWEHYCEQHHLDRNGNSSASKRVTEAELIYSCATLNPQTQQQYPTGQKMSPRTAITLFMDMPPPLAPISSFSNGTSGDLQWKGYPESINNHLYFGTIDWAPPPGQSVSEWFGQWEDGKYPPCTPHLASGSLSWCRKYRWVPFKPIECFTFGCRGCWHSLSLDSGTACVVSRDKRLEGLLCFIVLSLKLWFFSWGWHNSSYVDLPQKGSQGLFYKNRIFLIFFYSF